MEYWRPLTSVCPALTSGDEFYSASPPLWLAGFEGVQLCGFESYEVKDRSVICQALTLEEARQRDDARFRQFFSGRAPFAGLPMDRPHIMGILNVTPDSFSDGGQFATSGAAIDQGLLMLEQGASLLDVGGESTRPGADLVSAGEELARVIPVIEGLRARTEAPLSIDTRKPEVMEAAVKAGATIINDVSALTYAPHSLETAVRLDVPVVLMHAQGSPATMQDNPDYKHVCFDIYDWLGARVEAAIAAGIRFENIAVDPGIGFGKTLQHNAALLNGFSLYHGLGVPLLLGCSRKSFIAALDNQAPPHLRVGGSVAGALKGAAQGVQLLRVHDVRETRQALRVWFAEGL